MFELTCDFQAEEFITLADSRLSVFSGEEDGAMEDVHEQPQHKITDFTLVSPHHGGVACDLITFSFVQCVR